jgi:hypothetical protein
MRPQSLNKGIVPGHQGLFEHVIEQNKNSAYS